MTEDDVTKIIKFNNETPTPEDEAEQAAFDAEAKARTDAVPRDFRNDPAWLRSLLRRTWEELPDDLQEVFDYQGAANRLRLEVLHGQVLFAITPPEHLKPAPEPEQVELVGPEARRAPPQQHPVATFAALTLSREVLTAFMQTGLAPADLVDRCHAALDGVGA